MHKRRLLLGAGVLALLGLAALLLMWPTPRPGAGITPENYERIRAGMTEREIAGVLGVRAGDYSGGRAYFPADPRWPRLPHGFEIKGQETLRMWAGDEVAVYVWFDWRGTAVDKMLRPVPPGDSLWERLRLLLPW